MSARSRGTADQEGNLETQPLHFFRHMAHFLERGRDQAGEADDIGVLLDCSVKNPLTRHHHTQINHLVVITLHDHADDIFANVVHIAFDGRHHDFAFSFGIFGTHQAFFFLDEGDQVGNRLFHHAR